jgi:putative ABC transport system ATP-binding protein
MIEARDLCVVYGAGTPLEKRALNGLTLTVERGEFVCIIGSNGAGKSTLLGAIAGEAPLSRGTITVGGVDLTRMAPHRRAKHVARVFQAPLAGSCGTLTVAENLALASLRGRQRGLRWALRRSVRRSLTERVAELGTGLEDRLDSPMSTLSGGQRQALSLIMATLAGSEVLLLDEHTAALDPSNAEFVMRLSADVATRLGLTVLMVTHSMSQALSFGSRTVVLHEGRIEADYAGERRASLTTESLVAEFRRRHMELASEAALEGAPAPRL